MICNNFCIIEEKSDAQIFPKPAGIMQKHQKYRINPKVSFVAMFW